MLIARRMRIDYGLANFGLLNLTSSLRAKRSNPGHYYATLDCFASLAMTSVQSVRSFAEVMCQPCEMPMPRLIWRSA
jgi:hypothetical protein